MLTARDHRRLRRTRPHRLRAARLRRGLGRRGRHVRRSASAPSAPRTLNPYAALLRAGVPLAFGSDSPVTPLDPWGTVRAAAFHRTPEHRISVRAAFTAHTRGGWRAVGRDDAGVLVPGAPADYARLAHRGTGRPGPRRPGRPLVDRPPLRHPRPARPDARAPTCRSACGRWWADGRSSYGRTSDVRGRRGRRSTCPRARRATCVSSALTWLIRAKRRRSERLLTASGRRPVGSAGSTTGRPTGELSAQSSNAAGSGVVCRTGAPPLGARSSARGTGAREGSGRSAGATRVGPGRSVDNGFRSTRSQRVPGRPEGRRAPIRSTCCRVSDSPSRRRDRHPVRVRRVDAGDARYGGPLRTDV